MERFVVKKLSQPRIHNPPGWAGNAGGCLTTHIVYDTKHDKEFTSFGTEYAAKTHAEYYNENQWIWE